VPVPEGLEPIIHKATKKIGDCQSSTDTLRVAKWIMSQLKSLPQNPSDQPQQGKPGDKQDNERLKGNPHKSPGPARAPTGADAAETEPSLAAPEGKAGMGSWSENADLCKPGHHTKLPWLKENSAVPARLRYEVKRLFDNSGLESFQKNRKVGAINVNALHKVGLTDKLFQRRHEVEGIDSAVVICLDVSGSMFDDGPRDQKYLRSTRIVQAALTAKALLETLHRAQVATCLLTFGSFASVLKPFSEHASKAMPKIDGICNGGSTNDYFAVRYAHKLLLQRPEQRKIAFVITDGVGRPDYVRRQCRTGENLGITTIGVGIDAGVDHIYPQAISVSDMSELATVSFKQIKLAA
jgi:Mg-chelatase subunit ChlD